MKRSALAIVALLVPMSMQAQGSVKAGVQATSQTKTSVSTPRSSVDASSTTEANVNVEAKKSDRMETKMEKAMDNTADKSMEKSTTISAEARAELNAMYEKGRAKGIRTALVAQRVAEGEAKGASEVAIMTSSRRVMANLEASQSAMVKAGRTNPEPQEVERAASAMERGVTSAQIEAMTRRTPKERSLVVAFEVLSELSTNGRPVSQALSQVQSKLDARATDASISSLLTIGANGAGSVSAPGASAGLVGGVTGTVGGVIKKN